MNRFPRPLVCALIIIGVAALLLAPIVIVLAGPPTSSSSGRLGALQSWSSYATAVFTLGIVVAAVWQLQRVRREQQEARRPALMVRSPDLGLPPRFDCRNVGFGPALKVQVDSWVDTEGASPEEVAKGKRHYSSHADVVPANESETLGSTSFPANGAPAEAPRSYRLIWRTSYTDVFENTYLSPPQVTGFVQLQGEFIAGEGELGAESL